MTALEELVGQVCDFEYEAITGDQTESLENFYERISRKYSVTLRNTDFTADNVKTEQSINQELMMAQIKDIALDLAEVYSDDYCKDEIEYSCAFEHFQQELKDCFAMHFKADSKPVNVSD